MIRSEAMTDIEKVEFRTVDGIILRGHLYLASQYGPGIVLSPGVCQK